MVYLLFKGARYDFLSEQLAAYDAAVAGGTMREFLDVVYVQYARRFPIDLPLGEDPSPEFLALVSDDTPEPESEVHVEGLLPEELEAEMVKMANRQALIQKRRKQIATWFQYRYMKQHNVDPRSTDPSNPFTALLYSITGVHPTEKPRQKSAVNCWSKTQTSSINFLVRQWCIANNVVKKNSMAVWNRIAKEEFSKLSEEKQRYWERKAKDDHTKEVEEWKATRNAAISTKPEDRQRCVEGIVRLGQEFLDKLAEATGWKWTLIGGGPEPISEGRLTVLSLHGGTTNGEAKLNFGQKERELYLSQILPVFSKFLRSCYTPEECRSRALSTVDAIPLEDAGLEELGMSFDFACPSEAAVSPHISPSALDGTDSPATATDVPASHQSSSNAGADVPSQPTTSVEEVACRDRQSRTPSPPPSVMPSPLLAPAKSPLCRGRSITPLESPLHTPVLTPPVPTQPLPTQPLPTNPLPTTNATTATQNIAKTSDHIVNNAVATAPPPTSPPPSNNADSSSSLRMGLADVTGGSNSPPLMDLDVTGGFGSPPLMDLDKAPSSAPAKHSSGRKRQAPTRANAPPLKRARTSLSTSSAPTSASATPLSSAQWFAKATAMLETDSLGEPWIKLIQAWIAFEEAFHAHEGGKLSAKGRPPPVYKWIQRARKPDYRPLIGDSRAFGDAHVAWWISLQPEWRFPGNDGDATVCDDTEAIHHNNLQLARDDHADFENLRKPGVNGLLSVLASLFFWGSAVRDSGKQSRRWAQCVDDCMYVLHRLSSPA